MRNWTDEERRSEEDEGRVTRIEDGGEEEWR